MHASRFTFSGCLGLRICISVSGIYLAFPFTRLPEVALPGFYPGSIAL